MYKWLDSTRGITKGLIFVHGMIPLQKYRASGCLKGSGREIEECSECKRIAFSILYVIGEGENG